MSVGAWATRIVLGTALGVAGMLAAVESVHAQAPAASAAPAAPARVSWSQTALRLDGALDEPAWLRADSVTDFTQRDPAEGKPASERTVVRFVGTREGLWIGVWAYEAEPAQIRRAQLRRDADFGSDDSFTLMIDAQRDQRSGFVFSVNPNGAMFDAEILTFESQNADWDGIWDARARVTGDGWRAELFIPWQTMRYEERATEFGLNLRRYVRHKNEEALWRAWRRPEGIKFLEREGTLEGLRDLPARATAELRPYVVGTARLAERGYRDDGTDSVVVPSGTDGSAGLDLKLAPTSTLTLDLTLNTDFAQAEADRQVVNLSRFPLFFPERRVFFTEGAGTFDFGRVGQNQLFYSRRIGLGADGRTVPLLAGARLIGRAGDQQVGLLAVRTGGDDPATDVVARIKRDVLGRGYVGAIATFQQVSGAPLSAAAGADFYFPFIVKGQNVVVNGAYSAQQDSVGGHRADSWRFVLDYPNDIADINARVERVDVGYAPPLGFVQQRGVWRYSGQVELTPRPHRWGVRRLAFVLPEWNIVSNLDQTLNHAEFEVRPLGATFESGDSFELNVQHKRDVPTEAFELFPGTDIGAGKYQWNRVEFQIKSSSGRPIAVEFQASGGGFYDGTATEVQLTLLARVEPRVLASLDYQVDDVHRGSAGFTATTARVRFDYAANARFTTTLFGQYDNESRRLALNARLRWTRSPGSDAYVVWNSAWPTGLERRAAIGKPARGALIVKYVQYWRR